MRFWVLLAILVGAGCSKPAAMFPLREGWSGTYEVAGEFFPQVEEIKVLRTSTVLGVPGFVLGGPLGESRLAWKDGTLLAEQLAGTWYSPALPILSQSAGTEEWSGVAITLGAVKRASGTYAQVDEKVDYGGRKVVGAHVLIELELPGSKLEIQIWYAKGVGPVRWEQRVNTDRVQRATRMR